MQTQSVIKTYKQNEIKAIKIALSSDSGDFPYYVFLMLQCWMVPAGSSSSHQLSGIDTNNRINNRRRDRVFSRPHSDRRSWWWCFDCCCNWSVLRRNSQREKKHWEMEAKISLISDSRTFRVWKWDVFVAAATHVDNGNTPTWRMEEVRCERKEIIHHAIARCDEIDFLPIICFALPRRI